MYKLLVFLVLTTSVGQLKCQDNNPIRIRRAAAPEVVEGGCINDQTRDPNTGECVSCPPGQERDGETNECVTIVTRIFVADCRNGYIKNDKGKCVPPAVRRVAAPDVLSAGCIPGQTKDPVTGYCLTCPPGQERDGETNECVTIVTRRFVDDCPDGYTTNDKGQCVPIALRRLAAPDVLKAGCIPGQTRDPVTGYCLTCPPGQERDGETNECVTIVTRRFFDDCPDGYITNGNGKYVPIALRRLAAPDVLKAGCIPGQTRDPVTGYCLTCPPGQERDGETNECVTIVTRRFVDDCPDGYTTNDKGQCVPIALRRLAAPDVLKAGCIPGQTRDPVTGYCLTCPPGQERDGETNECVTIVTRRFFDDCPDGYITNGNGKCVPIALRRLAAPDVLKAGCIPGQTRDPVTGCCLTCPPGQERDGETNECVTIVTRRLLADCPDGYITNGNGKCVPIALRRLAAPDVLKAGCIPGQTRDPVTGYCLTCPPGQERDGETNECVTIVTRRFFDDCPDGYITNGNGKCVPIALRRLAAPDVLKAGCIPGQTRDPVTGYCLTCPPGQERDGETNECVTIVTRRFVDDCPDGYTTNDKGQERDGETNECVTIVTRRFFDDCPDGYITNGNGKCVPIALRRLAAPDVLKAGCIPGQTRDPVTGYCLTCPPGQERDGETNECVTIVTRRFVDDCPDGYTTNDKGQCVPIALRRLAAPDVLKAGCIPGQTRDPVTGYCLTCPPGQERDGETNECVTIVTRRLLADCRDGYKKNDKGKCVPLAVRRVAAPDVLSAGCIPGQTKDPVTGYCLTCPPGQERDAQTNECVTIVTRRFAFRRVASPEVYDFL
ncbi:hypothetical protein PYW07_014175 [Mythimna separata]|uniref:Uncharacterized protein n=1 Tax=Mythimna separata TaxID=271217 RepID=A0AAD7Z0I2_MYTSE|nr:hypothetical protein PYW07_014175 [Mythimna separata]